MHGLLLHVGVAGQLLTALLQQVTGDGFVKLGANVRAVVLSQIAHSRLPRRLLGFALPTSACQRDTLSRSLEEAPNEGLGLHNVRGHQWDACALGFLHDSRLRCARSCALESASTGRASNAASQSARSLSQRTAALLLNGLGTSARASRAGQLLRRLCRQLLRHLLCSTARRAGDATGRSDSAARAGQ